MSFLRRHPVLCLLLLSPGIPEYLSGSSPVSAIVLNPIQFLFQIAANLGLYGPGVLLIREAMVRWNKGWGSVLLLGGAYGILEEGVALSTLFDSKAAPVQQLGFYGHWVGVNWVWLAGIVPFHAVYSISVPILLLGLAVPWTKDRSLLSPRKLSATFLILAADVSGLFLLILKGEHFWMGPWVLTGSLLTIGVLVFAAAKLPATALKARTLLPVRSPRVMFIAGVFFYLSVLLLDGFFQALRPPAFIAFFTLLLVEGLFLLFVLRGVGSRGNEHQLVAFVLGLIVPIMTIGLVSQILFPLVLVADLAVVLFLRELWRIYPPRTESSATPVSD